MFTDDVEVGWILMNSEVCRAMCSAHIQAYGIKLIVQHFAALHSTDTVTQNIRQKLPGVFEGQIVEYYAMGQTPDLNLIEHAFNLLKIKLEDKDPRTIN